MNNQIHSIRYPFAIDDGFGKLAEERSYDQHIIQMIRQVLFTNPGERINRPDFGCGIRRMVFAPNSDVSANLTQVIINQALQKYLGNVIEVNEVKVESIDERLEINIVFLIKATQQRKYLNLEVTL
ncbi:hypothetical protein EI546_08965 [Aequorivita sp. H23M31]|uniref:IraD/Gp25-like domain-containing protein n=1 Tax=Aequorivita ciconiae TaxID=2494375 RepID=A0A410G3K0_9FLAO|nr:GPW/gp25 family protein [Aequorivita sp. H23M31]QAA81840.1 hypothetical protein EI546_08965 [Aequorivita sp. H23M31]